MSHGYGTTHQVCYRIGQVVGSGEHKLVACRMPAEWRSLTEEQRMWRSVGDFKRSSSGNFFRCDR
jgi:hypothetical protein